MTTTSCQHAHEIVGIFFLGRPDCRSSQSGPSSPAEGRRDAGGRFRRRVKREGRVQAEVIGHVHDGGVQHCEGGEETTRSEELPPSRERWRAGVTRPPRHTGQTDGRSFVTATVREGEDDGGGGEEEEEEGEGLIWREPSVPGASGVCEPACWCRGGWSLERFRARTAEGQRGRTDGPTW